MTAEQKSQIEGEGNKSADRHYREEARKHADTRDNRRAAKEAEEAVEGSEAEELERARKETASHEPDSSH